MLYIYIYTTITRNTLFHPLQSPHRSRNHIFEQGVDMLMSPVRRSSRILVTPSTSARKASRMEVIDLNDLPANQRVGVVPNSNLLLS